MLLLSLTLRPNSDKIDDRYRTKDKNKVKKRLRLENIINKEVWKASCAGKDNEFVALSLPQGLRFPLVLSRQTVRAFILTLFLWGLVNFVA